jgi:hypothetical protein
VLSSPVNVTTKKSLWLLSSGAPRFRRSLRALREPLSVCLPSLCLALVDGGNETTA